MPTRRVQSHKQGLLGPNHMLNPYPESQSPRHTGIWTLRASIEPQEGTTLEGAGRLWEKEVNCEGTTGQEGLQEPLLVAHGT